MRDFDSQPYDATEQRLAEFFVELSGGNVGAGDDPAGFMMLSYSQLLIERRTNATVRDVILANLEKFETAKKDPQTIGWFVVRIMDAMGGKSSDEAIRHVLALWGLKEAA